MVKRSHRLLFDSLQNVFRNEHWDRKLLVVCPWSCEQLPGRHRRNIYQVIGRCKKHVTGIENRCWDKISSKKGLKLTQSEYHLNKYKDLKPATLECRMREIQAQELWQRGKTAKPALIHANLDNVHTHLESLFNPLYNLMLYGLPWWLSGEESAYQCRRHRFDPWSRKIPHAMEHLSSRTTTTEPML